MSKHAVALPQQREISEKMWAQILAGRKVRYLVKPEQVEWAGKHARFCLGCKNIGHPYGDPRRAYCSTHRMMVGNTFPVLCREYA